MNALDRDFRVAGLGLGIVALYAVLVLASGAVDPADFGALLLLYCQGAAALALLAGLLACAWLVHSSAAPSGANAMPLAAALQYLKVRWRQDRFILLLWPPLLFALLMASFNAYKQMILIKAGFHEDPLLAHIDRMLFFGTDPWVITHRIFSSPLATYALDLLYHAWFVPMAVGVIVCAYLPQAAYRLKSQYLLSYILIWIVTGSILAYSMPAAGPVYYHIFAGGADFQPLLARIAADQAAVRQLIPDGQFAALSSQAMLLKVYGSSHLAMGGGISAMPSVHNALATLFALAAFRLNRTAGWIFALYAVLIWIGSIHLGWHYAIDGIVSVALTFGFWALTGRIADRLERPLIGAGPNWRRQRHLENVQ